MPADLIQRALITRIEHLESDARHATAIYGEIWRGIFPGIDYPGSDKAREAILAELQRRGVVPFELGKATE